VQIGGRRVGAVQEITLADNNEAVVRISVDDGFAPLHEGTSAAIRLTSLSGIANRYVALSPGPNSAASSRRGSTSPPTGRRRPSTWTSSSTRSTRDPAQPAERHPRLGHRLARRGGGGQRGAAGTSTRP
jgi:ABC-type transporter Mla subunit MlaD